VCLTLCLHIAGTSLDVHAGEADLFRLGNLQLHFSIQNHKLTLFAGCELLHHTIRRMYVETPGKPNVCCRYC
jgi:hypothetical protein